MITAISMIYGGDDDMAKTSGMRIVSEYIVVDGEKREIDLSSTDLPLRCKLAWAEMVTGKRHVVANPDDSAKSNKSQHQ